MKLIDKDKIVAEIERIKKEECPTDSYEGRCKLLWFEQFLSFLDTLEVKDMNLETDIERECVKCHIDIFDKKFPIMPTLKGQYLHDYKNFLNTCQQIFGLKRWGMHPTQAILFEKLTLLWATWGAQHLKGLFEMSPEERQKMDDIKVE